MPFVDSDVVVKQLTGSTWELVETVTYQGRVDTFSVPAGFITDFASVPRVFVWLLPRYGIYTRSAILHDHLCRSDVVSRRDADGLFRRTMREQGVSVVRRWVMWAAVRAASLLSGATWRERLLFAAVALPAVAYLLVPAVVVQVFLLGFWAAELVVWVIERSFTRRREERPEAPTTA